MTIIDRRLNDRNKNLNNRNKYFKRINQQLKDSIKEAVKNSDINDLLSSKKKKVSIPGKGLDQPVFSHKRGSGIQNIVTSGNEQFDKGARIKRPPGGIGDGSQDGDGDSGPNAGDGENGEDSFTFYLTKEEFLDIFFEDLELPDLIKKQMSQVDNFQFKRAGFSTTGVPAKLNILRSMKQAKGRHLAYETPLIIQLEELKEKLINLGEPTNKEEQDVIDAINLEIEDIKLKLLSIPYIQDNDLRYNKWKQYPLPITKAVMFAILDVSGSMGEWEKEMAKRFFLLLALFLECNYEKIEIRWITHTTTAKEVTEKEFFYSKENGGTAVSSALVLANDIIEKEYPLSQWNIFVSQISDGDNMEYDTVKLIPFLESEILPKVQYYAYAETRANAKVSLFGHGNSPMSELLKHYQVLEGKYKNIKSSVIGDVTQIYPIFRKLFEKKS